MGSCLGRLSYCWYSMVSSIHVKRYHRPRDVADHDALIGLSPSRNDTATRGIAMLSRGKIKYIHADISSGDYRAVPSHVDIPVIDPLLGHEFVSLSGQYVAGGEQTAAATASASSALNAKLLAHRSVTQFWTRDSTPPSSVDLEWEHEGLIPLAGIHGDGEFDGILDDDDDYGAAGDEASASDEDDVRVNSHSSNEDGWIDRDRSPASSSACNSLEWDTHADDLFLHAPRLSPYRHHPSGHK